MQIEDLKAAIAVGFLLTVILGPIFFLVIETAVLKGFKAALALDIGAVFADVAYIILLYYSTNSVLKDIKDNPYLFFLGGTFLVLYAVFTFYTERKEFLNQNAIQEKKVISTPIITANNYLILFIKGFVLNIVNIGVLGFWFTVIVTVGPQLDMSPKRMYSFFTMTLLIYLLIDMVKIFFAKRLKSKLTFQKIYYLKAFVSIVMFVFGCVLICKGVFK